jgi:hypothetical protein
MENNNNQEEKQKIIFPNIKLSRNSRKSGLVFVSIFFLIIHIKYYKIFRIQ